jgi:hypothetical protein
MSSHVLCIMRSYVGAAAVAALTVGFASTSFAQQPSLAGSWSGGGTVTLRSGNVEKVRCRATFSPSGNGASMSASCANATAKVTQTAELTRVSATRYVGEFQNPEFNISGSIRITLSGNTLNASLSGGGGSASMVMNR